MDVEELEVAPDEEDLFSIDETLPPVEAILKYSQSSIPAQRHAYIRGMGAAALHSGCAKTAGHLVCLALELLDVLQREEGTHELAGDATAELLILEQLGTLGCALLQLSCPLKYGTSAACTAAASSSMHEGVDVPACPPHLCPSRQSSQAPAAYPSLRTCLDNAGVHSVCAMADACVQRMSSCLPQGQAAEQLSPTTWPAAWVCSSPHQHLAWLDSSIGEPNLGATNALEACNVRFAALLSYAQLLRLLPRAQACQLATQHAGAMLHQEAHCAPPAQPQPAAASHASSPAAPHHGTGPEPLPGVAQHHLAKLPSGHLQPARSAAALSILAACGHATTHIDPGSELQDQCCQGGAARRLSSSGEGGYEEALSALAAQLLLRLSGAPGTAGLAKEEEEACQLVAVAHLPPLVTSLLRPTAYTFYAILLPVLRALAASPSWAVRRSVAGVLPVLLAALVRVAEEASEPGEQGGQQGPQGPAPGQARGVELPAARQGVGKREAGGGDAAAPRSEARVACCDARMLGAGYVAATAASLLSQQACRGIAEAGPAPGDHQDLGVLPAWGSFKQPGAGTAAAEGEQAHLSACRTGHKQQQQQQQQQQMCEAALELLVGVLGTTDVSQWVRSAAVCAAGPALCALPSWLAAQQTHLHALYADAVLAARPHKPGVVVSCASCLGAVVTKVGALVWAAPGSPLPLTYTSLMQAQGGAGGTTALKALVSQLPALAAAVGPTCAQEQLLPPLLALLPGRLVDLRGVLAGRSTLAKLASMLPSAGASQLLAFLPTLCSLDEGKEEGRCGLWRERHGLAVQLAALVGVALQAIDSKSSSSLEPRLDMVLPGDNKAPGHAAVAWLTANFQSRAAINNEYIPPTYVLDDKLANATVQGAFATSTSQSSSLSNIGDQMHDEDKMALDTILDCASILLVDPVWAVRTATANQLMQLMCLRY